MRISPKAGQGKSPVPRASKKVFSYCRRETFRQPSTFRLPSTTTAPPEGCFPPEHIFLLVWVPNSVWESLWSTFSWPKQKLRKNFFVQNDQAQYGRELDAYYLLLLQCVTKKTRNFKLAAVPWWSHQIICKITYLKAENP